MQVFASKRQPRKSTSKRVIHVLAFTLAMAALSTCGDDNVSLPRQEDDAPVTTGAGDEASGVLCADLMSDKSLVGDGKAVLEVSGIDEGDGPSTGCTVDFRADSTALAGLGFAVNPGCPPEASIVVAFSKPTGGSWSVDRVQTAELDNGACLAE